MAPDALNLASAANPVWAVCAPCESPIVLLIGEADGVASNSTENMPDCDVMGEFKNPWPDDAVTHGVFSKVAVNVVSVAGVEITCVWAPPSDQESNCHVWP